MGSLSSAFNPRMINDFKAGVELRDPEMVAMALGQGINPNTQLSVGEHPLLRLVHQPYEKNRAARELMNKRQYQENTSEIINLLFQAGVRVTDCDKYETGEYLYLADALMLTTNVVDASTVAIQAIQESLVLGEEFYRFDPTLLCEAYLVEMGPRNMGEIIACVNEALTMLEQVHDTVRMRLESMTGQTEETIMRHLMCKEVEYWLEPFQRPALKNLLPQLSIVEVREEKEENTKAPDQTGAKGFAKDVEKYFTKLQKKEPRQVLAEVDAEFIGCESFKKSLRKLVFTEQFRMARAVEDLETLPARHSCALTGNPGLGKTTGARKKAELLYALGEVGPNYVEVSRENVVAGYIGQTEQKMTAIFEAADVVFIDEAYSLDDGRPDSGDFGKVVINSLLTAIENNPKLVVFMAGYTDEMDKLLSANPGLRSRITRYEHFEDMDRGQLGQTLDLMLGRAKLDMDKAGKTTVLDALDETRRKLGAKYFGNARLVRSIVEQLPEAMAERLFGAAQEEGSKGSRKLPGKKDLMTATAADVQSLDLKKILGTSKKGGDQSLPSNHPDWEPSIGFCAKLRYDDAPAHAPANDQVKKAGRRTP